MYVTAGSGDRAVATPRGCVCGKAKRSSRNAPVGSAMDTNGKTPAASALQRKRISTELAQAARFTANSSGIRVALSRIRAPRLKGAGVLNRMKLWSSLLISVMALLTATPAFTQVNMATAGPAGTAFTFTGTRAGALSGSFLTRLGISNDTTRLDLVVGAPGSGPTGQGQVFVEFMGPPHTGAVSLSATDLIITGEAAGDRFGASVGGGL